MRPVVTHVPPRVEDGRELPRTDPIFLHSPSARLNASPSAMLDRDAYGDLRARCRRCHDRFNLSAPPEKACGYHPGELTANGYLCCGVVPRVGAPPVFCHWRPHVA